MSMTEKTRSMLKKTIIFWSFWFLPSFVFAAFDALLVNWLIKRVLFHKHWICCSSQKSEHWSRKQKQTHTDSVLTWKSVHNWWGSLIYSVDSTHSNSTYGIWHYNKITILLTHAHIHIHQTTFWLRCLYIEK